MAQRAFSIAALLACSFAIDAGPIRKGRSKNVGVKVTPAHRKLLKGKRVMTLRARLAPPSIPTRFRKRSLRIAVLKSVGGRATSSKLKTTKKRKRR